MSLDNPAIQKRHNGEPTSEYEHPGLCEIQEDLQQQAAPAEESE